MILLQVHLQKPCYDFCPVQTIPIKTVSTERAAREGDPMAAPVLLETVQSRAATGGVYKGQGRNQRELMTHTY